MIVSGRAWVVAGLMIAVAPAGAESFGGFAANEKTYLVGQTRICTPLAPGAAGVPACHTAATDEVAAMTTRLPSPERGATARVVATAKGKVLTVTLADGTAVATWSSPDPIVRVTDVWLAKTERVVAVELVVRRASRELSEVVAFTRTREAGPDAPPANPPPTNPPPTNPPPTVEEPGLAKAVAAARKAKGKAAGKAWAAVLALAPTHAEALYRLAALDMVAKRRGPALERLTALAASPDPDALEWRIEARFDKSFAKLVDDPAFRAAVGFDQPGRTTYERLMGFGGVWEQPLKPCDAPEMTLTLRRDRSFQLILRVSCQGMRDRVTYRGTWDATAQSLSLKLPKLDTGDDLIPCLLSPDGDEDVLRCQVDAELSFEARPTRR